MPHYVRPKKIYQYQVLDLLGKGGNGVVYKGIDMQNGTFVAIKQIIIQKQDIKSLKFEINVLKDLNDPFIVKYIDAFQISNKIYLILEYLEGGSLGSLVQKAPLEQNLVRKFIKQILKGLQYLHKHHVAHRDLKGTNILLTKQGRAKITDFGVAIQVNDTQKTLSSAGTPYWMAPQAVSSEGQTSVQCDIWSLGCTVIQLLTGNPPYHNLMPFPALLRIVQDQHPPLPNNVSPLCKDFLLKCFIKNPKLRGKANQLLKHRWIKEQSQTNSSSFNIDIQNLVIQNQKKIQQLIFSQNWGELYQVALKTTNKKTLYFNPNFPKINQTKNSDAKLKFLRQILLNNFQALKYLSSIRIFKKLFQRQIKDDFKITKMKGLDFAFDCYQLCEENNQIIIFTDDFMIYLQLILDHIVNKPEEWNFRMNHIVKIVEILFRAVHSNLLIEDHLHYILEQHEIFIRLLELSNFIIDSKNSELVFNYMTILKKNILYGGNLQKYSTKLKKLCELHTNQYDMRVLFQNISLIKSISQKQQIKKAFQQVPYFEQICLILHSLSKVQKITIGQQQILLEIIDLLLTLLIQQNQNLKKERIAKFFKVGGIKAINSIEGDFLKNDKIVEEIQKLIQLFDD